MPECALCGTRIGGNRKVCASCQASGLSVPEDGAAPELDRRCACGKKTVVPALDVCEQCWRDRAEQAPAEKLYRGLPTCNPTGRYICPCPCGGTVRPLPVFGGGGYYRCQSCGARAERPPMTVQPYKQTTPEQLVRWLNNPKRGMFVPKALRALRRSEGRNPWTGEPEQRRADGER